jgi:hypothetical protein
VDLLSDEEDFVSSLIFFTVSESSDVLDGPSTTLVGEGD